MRWEESKNSKWISIISKSLNCKQGWNDCHKFILSIDEADRINNIFAYTPDFLDDKTFTLNKIKEDLAPKIDELEQSAITVLQNTLITLVRCENAWMILDSDIKDVRILEKLGDTCAIILLPICEILNSQKMSAHHE